MPSVYILILNWNGHEDTIACMESLLQISYPNYRIVLIDNGSEKSSLDKILNWSESKNIKFIPYNTSIAAYEKNADEPTIKTLSSNEYFVLIQNETNLGFAAGNNVGIDYAQVMQADYVLLLNNDTVVEKDFLIPLIKKITEDNSVKAVTGQIRYFDHKEQIWNCGGNISNFGRINYLYPGQNIKNVPQERSAYVTFISGCALLIDYRVTGKLTDRFFYGEEDMEFALRLKKSGYKMACCFDSIIYHKVGRSISRATDMNIGKIYIFYLNRFINFKNYLPKFKWQIWRFMYSLYIIYLIVRKHNYTVSKAFSLACKLRKDSSQYNKVTKEMFQNALAMN